MQSPREYEYTVVDVFTTTPMEGNPLAVFPVAAGISDAQMQKIAGELNLSETVFLFESGNPEAAATARIFTPRREMDFAGHPTIGSAFVLAQRKELGQRFVIEENVGPVPIDVDRDGAGNPVFWLTTPPITFFETLSPSLCARLLGIPEDDILPSAPPQFVSAGSPFLFVALNSPQAVERVEFQQAHLNEALGSVNSVGTFVFSRMSPQSTSNFNVSSRMFAPHNGIPEDPATGSATGPLAAYMMKYGLLPTPHDVEFVSEQGAKMGRRSVLNVRVTAGSDPVIKIGGSAVTIASGRFLLSSAPTNANADTRDMV